MHVISVQWPYSTEIMGNMINMIENKQFKKCTKSPLPCIVHGFDLSLSQCGCIQNHGLIGLENKAIKTRVWLY